MTAVGVGGFYRTLALGSRAMDIPSSARSTVTSASWSYTDLKRTRLFKSLDDAVFCESEVDVDASALLYAKEFLKLLPAETAVPSVVVEQDGAVAFDWDFAPRSTFTVSIGPDGTLRYAGLFGFDTRIGKTSLSMRIPLEILTYIDRSREGAARSHA